MVTAIVFFAVENVHVAASPIRSQTQMQKAMENSCYFYTGDEIKHHLSDLNFAKIVQGNKIQIARCLKDLGPVISTRGKHSKYWMTTGRASSVFWAVENEPAKSHQLKSNTKFRLTLVIF